MGKLSAKGIKASLKAAGRYGDGDGLFLVVGKPSAQGLSPSASWIVRVQKAGRRRDIGLGSLSKVPLAKARERAAKVRTQVELGIDPVVERERESGIPTFADAAVKVHGENLRSWKNGKHRDQWLSTLKAYAFPTFGRLAIDKVEASHVRDALLPIWLEKPETARRVRQRINAVLEYAAAKNWRSHPLGMAGITRTLPKQPKEHGGFAAMPFAEVPTFLSTLRGRTTTARLALEAAILTAARSGEVRGAGWEEVDLEAALWTIPAARMKAGRTHVVPLSPQALDVFRRAATIRLEGSGLVFPGLKRGQPLSDMALTKVLRDMGEGVTAHGFRSSFRDWAAECSSQSGEVAEAALAHAVKNRVEAAYRRTDYLDARRELMAAWGRWCEGQTGEVVMLRAVG